MTDVTKPDRKAWRVIETLAHPFAMEEMLNNLAKEGYTIKDVLPFIDANDTPSFMIVAFDPALIMSTAASLDLDKLLSSLGASTATMGTPQTPPPPP